MMLASTMRTRTETTIITTPLARWDFFAENLKRRTGLVIVGYLIPSICSSFPPFFLQDSPFFATRAVNFGLFQHLFTANPTVPECVYSHHDSADEFVSLFIRDARRPIVTAE
jgi:hypothetical protein